MKPMPELSEAANWSKIPDHLFPSEDVELKDAFSPAAVHMLDPELRTAPVITDLTELIRTWSVPEQRLRTLDALRAVAGQYADRARADSAPVTLTGLRIAVDAVDRGPELTGTPDTVWVGTIHGAKGLEWTVPSPAPHHTFAKPPILKPGDLADQLAAHRQAEAVEILRRDRKSVV